jgi:hypothetical protein
MVEEKKHFAELIIDEQVNLRFLYQVGKGLKITKQSICISHRDKECLEEIFADKSCTTLAGVYTVLKDTYFANYGYIYIKQPTNKRKNGERL